MSLCIDELMEMQRLLQEKYQESWGGLSPRVARDKLLWSVVEAGEAADFIKKCGDRAIMTDPKVKHDFTEEMCDTVMYLMEVLMCYGISAEEFSRIYREKFERNMHRWE